MCPHCEILPNSFLLAHSSKRPSLAARGLIGLVRFYRRLSPYKGVPTCRFTPSCSAYALEALSAHGALRGTWLSVVRILKCQPFHPGGHDPVPPARGARNNPSPRPQGPK